MLKRPSVTERQRDNWNKKELITKNNCYQRHSEQVYSTNTLQEHLWSSSARLRRLASPTAPVAASHKHAAGPSTLLHVHVAVPWCHRRPL